MAVAGEKKKKRESCTQRSKDFLVKQGYTVANTEKDMRIPDKTVPGGWKIWKVDLFNMADLVAVKIGETGTLYVQTTTVSNQSSRLAKMRANPILDILIRSGNRVHCHGWALKGPRGGRKTWQVTVTDLANTDTIPQPASTAPSAAQPSMFESPVTAGIEEDFIP